MQMFRGATAVALAVVGACALTERDDQAESPRDSAATAAAAESTAALVARADASRIRGDPAAPIWVLIVSDFQCPYCKDWHDQTYEALDREFVRPGQIRLAYLHFPLPQHQHAQATAELSMCAGAQGKFWELHDAIFDSQRDWNALPAGAPFFDSLTTTAGLDAAEMRRCMASRTMTAIVQADRERAQTAGVSSTPTFLIGTDERLQGAQTIAAFREAIARARRKEGVSR